MLQRLCIGLGVLLLAVAVAVPLWISAHRTDLPAPDDSDLVPSLPQPAEDANGWTHVLRANELSTLGDEDDDRLFALISGAQSDDAWLSRKLRENRPAFAELERAIAAPEMVLPEDESASRSDPGMRLFEARRVAVLLANLQARQLRAKGERRAALEHSLFGVRFGAALQRARNPSLITAMASLGSQNQSLREARNMDGIELDADDSLRVSREIESYRSSPAAWRAAWAHEYRFHKKTLADANEEIMRHAANGPAALFPRDFLWQPNRTLTWFAEQDRLFAAAYAEPCSRWPAPEEKSRRSLIALVSGNGIGVVLRGLAGGARDRKLNDRRCHNEARLALFQVEVALRAHGAPPDSLDALVPRYLDRVPQDPFDGAPLRYDRARGIVYSVGSDLAASSVLGPPSPDDELEPAIYVP